MGMTSLLRASGAERCEMRDVWDSIRDVGSGMNRFLVLGSGLPTLVFATALGLSSL